MHSSIFILNPIHYSLSMQGFFWSPQSSHPCRVKSLDENYSHTIHCSSQLLCMLAILLICSLVQPQQSIINWSHFFLKWRLKYPPRLKFSWADFVALFHSNSCDIIIIVTFTKPHNAWSIASLVEFKLQEHTGHSKTSHRLLSDNISISIIAMEGTVQCFGVY